jgi:DNA mismatch endonuclease, patch repair protein
MTAAQRPFLKPSPQTSRRMSRVRSRGTSVERRMATILRRAGIKYRSQPKVFGHPDFRLVGTRAVIFCDSSFWHGRRSRDTSGIAFKRNRQYWQAKLARNHLRDKRIRRELRRRGWLVLRFWDTDLSKPGQIVGTIERRVYRDDRTCPARGVANRREGQGDNG